MTFTFHIYIKCLLFELSYYVFTYKMFFILGLMIFPELNYFVLFSDVFCRPGKCGDHGECSELTQNCTCADGFSGTLCERSKICFRPFTVITYWLNRRESGLFWTILLFVFPIPITSFLETLCDKSKIYFFALQSYALVVSPFTIGT